MSPGRNRLTDSASPYLLQHAGNPVHWWEWCDEAFAEARERDVPVLLSIGYAACHWCHVMAHESFEDEGVAALMNRDFVCIKVDREERPDVDAIYMDAVQAMTGHGGWPLTAFLTPDGRPFYAGTYFPPEDRHGLPGFPRLLGAIAETWRGRRGEAEEQAAQVTLAIGREARVEADGGPLDAAILDDAVRRIVSTFDPTWGGFGPAPKFPQPMVLEFLLRRAVAGDGAAREPLLATLDAMAAGGIFDQVGGGFHRYSTDARWLVPHFEKMLYDDAQLARLYVRAWQAYGRPQDRRVALATCDHMVRDLQRPEGGFSSSLDADTEGVEGRFYVWDWDGIVGVVGEDAARAFGASPAGNWEGTNVLTCADLTADLDDAREALRLHRAARVDPATDDKVLAGWNGVAIGALAEAGAVFGRDDLLEEARRAAGFVLDHLVEDGRLHRSWRSGRLGPLAVSDDHALLADGLLTLHGRTGESRWLVAAHDLVERLLDLFEDQERGGFFSTGRDAEPLLLRPKDLQDNAVPSGNSAAAEVLLRMASLCGEPRYARAATGALALVRPVMASAPRGFGTALCALDRHLSPPREVAIIGDPDEAATRALVAEVVARGFLPDVALAVAAPTEVAGLAGTFALLEGRSQVGGAATAYVCERFACRTPVTDAAALAEQLDAGGPGTSRPGAV